MVWVVTLSPFIIWAIAFYFIVLMVYFLGEYLLNDSLGATLSHRVYMRGVTINTDSPITLLHCTAYGTGQDAAVSINHRRR